MEYGIVVAKNVMVPTRDGVRLAFDIYRPARDGGFVDGRFPTIMLHTRTTRPTSATPRSRTSSSRGATTSCWSTCATATAPRRPRASTTMPPRRTPAATATTSARVPQIELASGDNATALVFRHLEPLTDEDAALLERLHARARDPRLGAGRRPGQRRPLEPATSELYHELPEFGVRIGFRPTDFTQVNYEVNRVLVARAVRLLDPQPGERVADLFAGSAISRCRLRGAAPRWSASRAIVSSSSARATTRARTASWRNSRSRTFS